MVPCLPASCLVVPHADLAFAILEGTLNPKSLSLCLHQAMYRHRFWHITKTVLFLYKYRALTSDKQAPVTRLYFFTIPQPYISMQYLEDVAAIGAIAQFLSASCRSPLALHPFGNLDRVALRYCSAWISPRFPLRLGIRSFESSR